MGKGPLSCGMGQRQCEQRLGGKDGADVVLWKFWGGGRPGLPHGMVLRVWGGISRGLEWGSYSLLHFKELQLESQVVLPGSEHEAGVSSEPGREQRGHSLQTLHSCASASLFDLEHLSWEVLSHF